MTDDIKSSIAKHIQWTEYINHRLEIIYRDICLYEKQINLHLNESDSLSLLDLLEKINELHDTAKSCTFIKTDTIARDIDQQIDSLQNKIGLLNLENAAAIACDQNENEAKME